MSYEDVSVDELLNLDHESMSEWIENHCSEIYNFRAIVAAWLFRNRSYYDQEKFVQTIGISTAELITEYSRLCEKIKENHEQEKEPEEVPAPNLNQTQETLFDA
jgi:hypothetical protein